MRIVVTGATSFIGRAVVEELLDKRHQVFAAVRPDSAGRGGAGNNAAGDRRAVDCTAGGP